MVINIYVVGFGVLTTVYILMLYNTHGDFLNMHKFDSLVAKYEAAYPYILKLVLDLGNLVLGIYFLQRISSKKGELNTSNKNVTWLITRSVL